MLGAAESVEKTMLGNVICEEAAADTADPELDKAVEVETEAAALEDGLSTRLLEAPIEDVEVDEVALVI
jgi:hypothetical protein